MFRMDEMSTIRFLKTFVAVAQTGSFTAAADLVALTVPAVSQQMRGLETELGHTLFEREGRQLRLSSQGHRLLPRIQTLIAQYEALKYDGDGLPLQGQVSLGVVSSALPVASNALLSLEAEHPRLQIRLEGLRTHDITQGVTEGRFALGVVVGTPETQRNPALNWTPLYREPLRLIASARYADAHMTPAELIRNHRFIGYDRNSYTGSRIQRIYQNFESRSPNTLELNSLPSIVELVRQNVGVAIIPLLKGFALANDASLSIVSITRNNIYRHVGLIQKTGGSDVPPPVLARILEALRDALA